MKRLATNVRDLTLRLRQTLQDFPFFGSKEANDDAVLPEGWTAIDTENMRLHIHDGSTRGGKTLPNQEDVENVVASASDAAVTSAVEQANSYTDGKVIKDYASYSSLPGTPAGTQFVDNILNGPQGEMYKWNDTLRKYEILRTVTEFSGVGTDVPQPGVNYGPVVSVGGNIWVHDKCLGYAPARIEYGSSVACSDLGSFLKTTKNNIAAMWGSSTAALSTETSNCYNLYSDGMMFPAIARHGSPIALVYNGGIGGYLTSQIKAKFLSEIAITPYSIAILQPAANDLNLGGTADSVKSDVVEMVSAGLMAGKTIILVTPFLQAVGVTSGVPAEFVEFRDFCLSLCHRWPGRVFVADVFAAINGSNGLTPTNPAYLDTVGKHLNCLGSWIAATAWEYPFYQLFGDLRYGFDIASLGIGESLFTPSMPPSGWTNNGNVVESAGSNDEYGRIRTRLTMTGASPGYFYNKTTSLILGKKYRAFADIEIKSAGAYPCGIYFRSEGYTVSTSFGSAPHEDYSSPPVGTRMRIMTIPIIATSAIVTGSRVGIAYGGPGGAIDVASLGLFQID